VSGREPAGAWHPEELIAREQARNAETWEALVRLGVREGRELALEFVYETGGVDADRALAAHLRTTYAYEAVVESNGVTGETTPMAVSPAVLDAWIVTMVLAGHEHGPCAFDGWTATVSAGSE
jgi:hypothetical protein